MFLRRKLTWVIIVILAVILLVWAITAIRNSSLNKAAAEGSKTFQNIQENLVNGKTKLALSALETLQKNGTEGYKFLAYLQEATVELNNKEPAKALTTLAQIQQLNIPTYYKDFAKTVSSSIKLDSTKDLTSLIAELKKVPKTSAFYYPTLQLLEVAYYCSKEYQKALDTANQIITSDTASPSAKQSAKALKALALQYVK